VEEQGGRRKNYISHNALATSNIQITTAKDNKYGLVGVIQIDSNTAGIQIIDTYDDNLYDDKPERGAIIGQSHKYI